MTVDLVFRTPPQFPNDGRQKFAFSVAHTRAMRRKIPLPPQHLNALALAEWRRITPLLHAEGLLSGLDVTAIASYCTLVARIIEAERAIQAEGSIIETPSGIRRANPWIAVANTAMRQASAVGGTLGLSPSARMHVALTAEGQQKRYEQSFIKM